MRVWRCFAACHGGESRHLQHKWLLVWGKVGARFAALSSLQRTEGRGQRTDRAARRRSLRCAQLASEDSGQRAEDRPGSAAALASLRSARFRGRRAEDRGRRTEGRGQRAEGRGQTEQTGQTGQRGASLRSARFRGRRAEGRGRRTEGRGQRAEDGGRRTEGRGQRTDGADGADRAARRFASLCSLQRAAGRRAHATAKDAD